MTSSAQPSHNQRYRQTHTYLTLRKSDTPSNKYKGNNNKKLIDGVIRQAILDKQDYLSWQQKKPVELFIAVTLHHFSLPIIHSLDAHTDRKRQKQKERQKTEEDSCFFHDWATVLLTANKKEKTKRKNNMQHSQRGTQNSAVTQTFSSSAGRQFGFATARGGKSSVFLIRSYT